DRGGTGRFSGCCRLGDRRAVCGPYGHGYHVLDWCGYCDLFGLGFVSGPAVAVGSRAVGWMGVGVCLGRSRLSFDRCGGSASSVGLTSSILIRRQLLFGLSRLPTSTLELCPAINAPSDFPHCSRCFLPPC